jgi:hypothetical protein
MAMFVLLLMMCYIVFRVFIELLLAVERAEVIRLPVVLGLGLSGRIGHFHATNRIFMCSSHSVLLSSFQINAAELALLLSGSWLSETNENSMNCEALNSSWTGGGVICNPILCTFVVCEIAQQHRAKILNGGVIIHIPEHRGAVVAAAEEVLTIGGEDYILHTGCVADETTEFLSSFRIP